MPTYTYVPPKPLFGPNTSNQNSQFVHHQESMSSYKYIPPKPLFGPNSKNENYKTPNCGSSPSYSYPQPPQPSFVQNNNQNLQYNYPYYRSMPNSNNQNLSYYNPYCSNAPLPPHPSMPLMNSPFGFPNVYTANNVYSYQNYYANMSTNAYDEQHTVHRSYSESSISQNKNSKQGFKIVGNNIQIICRQQSEPNLSKRNVKNRKKQSILSLRQWESRTGNMTSNKPGFQFTLMSYNVLAQDLILNHAYLYNNHDQKSLPWETRWNKLMNEIKTIDPDILCLQEVQKTHLDYYKALETLGYQSLYKKRTSDEYSDGCAIFFKSDKIVLSEYITVEFKQTGPLLNRNNVAIITKLAPKDNIEQEFVVATTHLLYNPKREDVRLAQVQLLLAEIDRIAFKALVNGKHTYLPTIITGDFNTPPQSFVYSFITEGNLNLKATMTQDYRRSILPAALKITNNSQHNIIVKLRQTLANVTRREEENMIEIGNSDVEYIKTVPNVTNDFDSFSNGEITHNFPFQSVYKPREKGATTNQNKWLMVDYIFYSGQRRNKIVEEDKLKLLMTFKLPTKKELGNMLIPNHELGSDHLSLAAKFKLEF
ncbi:protein angel homolog 2 isoform X2 [Aethina tumida]|nr:protein angel homolog 2 isoform X2 [Aethina tumida]